jgi:hypothetical protein
MSSEDAMGGRAGSAPPSSAATASEVEGVAQEAPPPAARPVRVLVSPVAADGSSAAGTVLPPAYSGVLYLQQRNDEWPPMRGQQQGEDGDDPKKMRAKWFNDMRGWLMVVAVQVASVTSTASTASYQPARPCSSPRFPRPRGRR